MNIEIRIPTPGESITEVDLAQWLVSDGDFVEKDQELAEIESDKATLPLIAEQAGQIKILVAEGETVAVGKIACTIDTSVEGSSAKEGGEKQERAPTRGAATDAPTKDVATPLVGVDDSDDSANSSETTNTSDIKITPLAKKIMEAEGLNIEDVLKGLRKISASDVKAVLEAKDQLLPEQKEASREIKREGMSQLRRKLAARLVSVKNETAMLTTFNEVDMAEVIRLRKKYQPAFVEKHGVKLGFMSFFVKAATIALQEFPKVNSQIDGTEVLVPEYVDISIAVQTDKGLMVPVLRNTETMGLAGIEKGILELADKARKFRLSIDEMTGGTFSITNGGVFGSMLSTPIINPPQSAILGMHNIVERPVAINGEVLVHPIMYLALSYDHRIIDGRDSVSFLKRVKELIEAPEKMLLDGADPIKALLKI